jgi:hypothetical protein
MPKRRLVTAKGVETTIDTDSVVYKKYTTQEHDAIGKLEKYLMDPRLNLSEIAHRHYAKFNPGRKRSTSRTDLYNKFTYRKAFQSGELENLKKELVEFGKFLLTANNLEKVSDVSVVNVGDDYIKSLNKEDYQKALQMTREMREQRGDNDYILPYYVNTPKPYIVNIAWYEHHVRDEKIQDMENSVKELYEAMDLLGISQEEAKNSEYTLNYDTRDKLYKIFTDKKSKLRGKKKDRVIELLDPNRW